MTPRLVFAFFCEFLFTALDNIARIAPWEVKSFPLTHYVLVDSSTVICWISSLLILGLSGLFCHFYSIFDGKSW